MYVNQRPNFNLNNGYSGQIMHGVPLQFEWNQEQMNRNQLYPYQIQQQNVQWNPYQQQGPYYPHQYQPVVNNYQSGVGLQNSPYSHQQYQQKDSQFLFHNPLQPKVETGPKSYMPINGYPMMNPYPKNNVIPKQPGGMQSFMNSFKSQDGSVDFNKMVNTAGQMMNAVSQVSNLVKGLGGMFKL